MNPTHIDLKTLTYLPQIKIVDFGYNNYMLYNSDTNAFLFYDSTKGICFSDDNGEHFVFKGKLIFEIETDTEHYFLDRGESRFVESIKMKFHYCHSWSEVYFRAVNYFVLFSE
jgi:hypothetical protein